MEKDDAISPLETQYDDGEILDHLAGRYLGDDRFRLFSFEVKKKVNNNSFREDYMQAVSNSSWAHEGYLIAPKVDIDKDDTEIEMLNILHGIGVAEIKEDGSTEIIIPAKPRKRIPGEVWSTVMKVFAGRDNFERFIKGIDDSLSYDNARHFYSAIGGKNIPKKDEVKRVHREVIDSLKKKKR